MINVSNDIKEALDLWLSNNKHHNEDELLDLHMYQIIELFERGIGYENEFSPLNTLSLMDMAKVLLFGYK